MLVGITGKLFKALLKEIGIYNQSYYINVIRCYPRNRPPNEHEIKNCLPYLIKEIREVNPKIICLLGGTALRTYWGNPLAKVSTNLNKIKINNGRIVTCLYHPSYVFRPKSNTKILDFIKQLVIIKNY